jgi:2-polyprenyl-6-methoxyphenol hydroxylase-like FAD-dependent oxidoreductase
VRITCVGAGPAGLYFAILARHRDLPHEVTVIERNSPREASGWGIVLSGAILDKLRRGDPESARAIEAATHRWREDYVNIRGQRVIHVSDTDIFSMTRPRLVEILTNRARELGVQIRYNEEVSSVTQLADADLVLAADGANSTVRSRISSFGTSFTESNDKYIWLGTDRPFGAFEYFFVETAHGWIWAAGYGAQTDRSTFLVHCTPQTWSGLGFGDMPIADSLDVLRKLFAEPLAGARLMGHVSDANSGRWQSFRTVTNERWHAGNVVLVGDSAHATHFSTGLGTGMAIEDAITLDDALRRHDRLDLALEAYERQRKADLKPAQDAARLSSEWFADISRYIDLNPRAFAAALYARRSPLVPLLPPRLWYGSHRVFGKLPALHRLATRLYPAAQEIRRRTARASG